MLLSPDNPKIKLIRKLKDKKTRDKESLFFIEGINGVEEAIEHGVSIEYILCSSDWEEEFLLHIRNRGFSVSMIDKDIFGKISDTKTPQGILAVVKKQKHETIDLFKADNPFFVLCDGIQDPGNLGTIIRSASAAGCSGVAVSKNSADVYSPKAVRSTGGCVFHMPILSDVDLKKMIREAKEKNIRIISADAGADKKYCEAELTGPFAVIIGSEANGISEEIKALCDESISIPTEKNVNSLNAAVSASIILFEAVRQRRGSRR